MGFLSRVGSGLKPAAKVLASRRMATAQILTIGDELLSGDTVNSNLAFLGERCRRLGISVIRALSVRDRIDEIVAAGYARTDVERVTRLIKVNEYKRRQAPVGIRITHRAFGRDWRYPITSKFRA